MDGRRQATRFWLEHVRYVSNIFLRELVQSRPKQQDSGETKLNKKTVEMLLNELLSLDDRENEIKMEEYAEKIGVRISV